MGVGVFFRAIALFMVALLLVDLLLVEGLNGGFCFTYLEFFEFFV